MHAPAEEALLAPFPHYVGRQPILDAQQCVFGYELLSRSGPENCFSGDSDEATRQMIDNALVFGMDTLAPNGKAFLKCTRESLVQRLVTTLPPARTVLEIPNTIGVDEEMADACADLQRMGYSLSLSDFQLGTTAERLLPLAEFVKLDWLALDIPASHRGDLERGYSHLAGLKLKWIAEKVETQEQFERALSVGFTYFQGYFFAYPTILTRREIPPSQMLYVQLMSEISRSPYDERAVERLVMAEASLCFRLLRLVNSPALAIRGQITSIRQALLRADSAGAAPGPVLRVDCAARATGRG
jgi:EAL and modified HD-GYP domain-containing signal transduction protein